MSRLPRFGTSRFSLGGVPRGRGALVAAMRGALLVAGFLGAGVETLPSHPPPPADELVVSRQGVALPAGCSPRGLAMLVDAFFGAFNRGDWNEVEALFAASGPEPPNFQLFSWERDVVQQRERVTPYLAALRARGEQLRLLSLLATKEPRVASSVVVEYVFERPGGLGTGKGLVDCEAQRVWQWAMAPRPGPLALPCPKPHGWSPSGPVIACTDGPNAKALDAGFRLGAASRKLLRPCRPLSVKGRVAAVLAAFNSGLGDTFTHHFAGSGRFQPYTAAFSRTRIARFVRIRYRAGDGWTATRLYPPRASRGSRAAAVFLLDLRV